MIVIDTNSKYYQPVSRGIACVIGFGANLIVNTLCNAIINSRYTTGPKRTLMKCGAIGLETIAMYDVSTAMKNEIDEFVEKYNEFATVHNSAAEQTREYINSKNAD